VRAYYARRVCLLGAESTGTTTLTRLLAETFGTTWVAEYGRAYSLPKDAAGETWTTADFEHIAREQQRLEDEAAREADRILFCDTDALATAIWHEQYLGGPAPSVMEIARSRTYDLTFLTAADFPWVQDGTRNSDAVRQWMQRRFEAELAHRSEPVVELRGPLERRLGTALEAIETHLQLRPHAAEGEDRHAARQVRS
jgi:NadR type nicotinamide-nucleotide adenylyltransferase